MDLPVTLNTGKYVVKTAVRRRFWFSRRMPETEMQVRAVCDGDKAVDVTTAQRMQLLEIGGQRVECLRRHHNLVRSLAFTHADKNDLVEAIIDHHELPQMEKTKFLADKQAHVRQMLFESVQRRNLNMLNRTIAVANLDDASWIELVQKAIAMGDSNAVRVILNHAEQTPIESIVVAAVVDTYHVAGTDELAAKVCFHFVPTIAQHDGEFDYGECRRALLATHLNGFGYDNDKTDYVLNSFGVAVRTDNAELVQILAVEWSSILGEIAIQKAVVTNNSRLVSAVMDAAQSDASALTSALTTGANLHNDEIVNEILRRISDEQFGPVYSELVQSESSQADLEGVVLAHWLSRFEVNTHFNRALITHLESATSDTCRS